MPRTATDPLSVTFIALADPTRRSILNRLASDGPTTVNELAAPFDISLPAISRHLKVLENARLIRRDTEAQWRRCSLAPEGLQVAASWIGRYEKFWGARLDGLEDYLDEIAALEGDDE